jgi:hypothetical protein
MLDRTDFGVIKPLREFKSKLVSSREAEMRIVKLKEYLFF